jgi:hypothetical protein
LTAKTASASFHICRPSDQRGLATLMTPLLLGFHLQLPRLHRPNLIRLGPVLKAAQLNQASKVRRITRASYTVEVCCVPARIFVLSLEHCCQIIGLLTFFTSIVFSSNSRCCHCFCRCRHSSRIEDHVREGQNESQFFGQQSARRKQ